ncbi:MAG: ComEA family DNA-binding protein [Bacilli bacterium]|nr:ComEA family DNA-binding protein [Bacilli bacterium]
MIKLLIGAVVAAFIVIVGFLILDPELETKQPETAEVISSSQSGKYSIEGEVNKTGTFSFNDTPTMDDLISAAGGLTSNADERAYFTTYELTAGKTYYIASYYESSDLCGNGTIQKANINTDDAETLAEINGISKTIATSIVSYRLEKGDYKCLEDLLDVYGIGNATYRKIRNYVILHE